MKTKTKNKTQQFDERQLQIRASVYQRNFGILLGLLLADAAIGGLYFEIAWAAQPFRSMLIALLSVTIITAEFILRGVYFTKRGEKIFFLAMNAFAALAYSFFSVANHFARNIGDFLREGITDFFDFNAILPVYFFAMLVCTLIRIVMDKFAAKSAE